MVIKVIRLKKGPLGADAELVIAYLEALHRDVW